MYYNVEKCRNLLRHFFEGRNMEYIVILITVIITILVLYYAFNINIKKIKEIKENSRIKEITDKFPNNEEICKSILKKLDNENVNIKVEEESKNATSLYVVLTNSIIIGNINNIYTRIQTIAHECIHSVQNKRILWFNYIYTNLFNLYFIVSIILTIIGVYKNHILHIAILLVLGFIIYIVRSYLETDAMVRAEYLSKSYMEEYIKENKICNRGEVEEIYLEYKKINKIGIPTYNFILFLKSLSKVLGYTMLVFILELIKMT